MYQVFYKYFPLNALNIALKESFQLPFFGLHTLVHSIFCIEAVFDHIILLSEFNLLIIFELMLSERGDVAQTVIFLFPSILIVFINKVPFYLFLKLC